MTDPTVNPAAQIPGAPLPPPSEPPIGSIEPTAPAVPETPPVTHNEPILLPGCGGPTGPIGDAVERLARLLAKAGYATSSLIRGENPDRIFEATLASDVRAFKAAQGISEDPAAFAGRPDPGALAEAAVGAHTWQALYEVAEAK